MSSTQFHAIEVPTETVETTPTGASPELVIDPLLDRFDLGFLLRRYWKRLLFVPIGMAIAGFVVASLKTPLYESAAVIMVDPSYDQILQFEEVGNGHRSDMEALKSLEVAIMADSVLQRVMDSLELRKQSDFLPKALSEPGVPDLKVLKFLRNNRIKTTLMPETRLIEIQVLDPVPKRAQQIALALSTEFEVYLGEQRSKEAERARETLEKQSEGARAAALESDRRLKEFRESNPHFVSDRDHELFANRLSGFGQQLNGATGHRMALESQDQALKELDPETSPMEIIEVAGFSQVPHISTLLNSLSASRARFAVIKEDYTPDHRDYRLAEAEVNKLEGELKERATKIKTAVHANYLAASAREKILVREVDSAKSEFIKMKEISSEFRAIDELAERDWAVFAELQSQLRQSAVAATMPSQIATMVSEPMLPYKKAKPSRLLHLVVGGFAGTLLAGGSILVAIFVGLPVSNRRQLEQRTGASVIADWSDSKKGQLQIGTSTNLLNYLGGSRDKTIQVSAPELNGVGESVATKVAATAAINGRRTLLLLVKPHSSDFTIRETRHPNLFCQTVDSNLVLDKDRFQEGLRHLQAQFDNIFIEAGGVDDPDLVDFISRQSDKDVIVVCKGRTKKQLVDDRMSALSREESDAVSLIMVDEETGAPH